MDERRSHTRKLTCIPAYFESKPESQDLALIRDVSVSGARLYTRVKLDAGGPVTLHLYLGEESSPPRQAAGRVVRVDRRESSLADLWAWEIGVEFDEPISAYEAEIQDLCRRQEAVGILRP